jgi:hypothetical protein
MPGVAELQSLVTLEAMASGLPVVAADAMALPHLVRPGMTGRLHPPGDAAALAGHLADLLGDPALRDRYGAAGRLLAGAPFRAGTAKRPVARLSPATAAAAGVLDGALLTVATDAGSITLPAVVTDMADHVVWLPTASAGSQVREALRAVPGDLVRVGPAADAPADGTATDEEVTA